MSDLIDLIFSWIFLFLELVGIKKSPKKKAGQLTPLPPPPPAEDEKYEY